MYTYSQYMQTLPEPRLTFLQGCSPQADFQEMRYGLCSALMFDGYFAFTDKDEYESYHSTLWYDEYAVDITTGQATTNLDHKGYLGRPLGAAYNVLDLSETLLSILAPVTAPDEAVAQTKVWRRDFEHGIVLINPTTANMDLDLGGSFRAIAGIDHGLGVDPANDGRTGITTVTLDQRGGIILLRP